jgi:hypothetical protein
MVKDGAKDRTRRGPRRWKRTEQKMIEDVATDRTKNMVE